MIDVGMEGEYPSNHPDYIRNPSLPRPILAYKLMKTFGLVEYFKVRTELHRVHKAERFHHIGAYVRRAIETRKDGPQIAIALSHPDTPFVTDQFHSSEANALLKQADKFGVREEVIGVASTYLNPELPPDTDDFGDD